MPSGGKRQNAGRKKKWGDMPTKRIIRVVPAHLIAEIDVAIENVVAQQAEDDFIFHPTLQALKHKALHNDA